MAKKVPIPGLQPVRPMDPEWQMKFKSLKELNSEKRKSLTNKLNSRRKLTRNENE